MSSLLITYNNRRSLSFLQFQWKAVLSIIIRLFLILLLPVLGTSHICRTSCGNIPINYPFGIDYGCGSPYYRRLLVCNTNTEEDDRSWRLELRTPSGRYPVRNISYTDPHLVVTDPLMWKCEDGNKFRPTRAFSLDSSTHLSLSSQNDYLFFNCSETQVIVEPKPIYCERFPDRCDSSCDSASYLCRHLPDCASALQAQGGGGGTSCCSYYPKATDSLRMMLRYCGSYTSVYWRSTGAGSYDQAAEYGIRIDFDIPVTTHCLECQDTNKGGGTCGFDTQTESFLCLCHDDKNITTYCKDSRLPGHSRTAVIAGTVTAVSAAGAIGIGAGIWFLKKVRAKAPVTCGVQTTDNRLF